MSESKQKHKSMAALTCLLLLSISWIRLSEGLYFHLQETENKCFLEEVPSETMIVGQWAQ